jgi:hypothetical protein
LEVSAKEYSQAVPINFGAERIDQISKASGIDVSARANTIEAARRQRHTLLPLDHSSWRRLFVRNGRVLSALPDIDEDHPLLRPEHAATLIGVLNTLRDIPLQRDPAAQSGKADLERTVVKPRPEVLPQEIAPSSPTPSEADLDRTAIRQRPEIPPQGDAQSGAAHEKVDLEQTMIAEKLTIGEVRPTRAKIYAFLEIQDGEGERVRIAIPADQAVIGRYDAERGISPTIDLSPFDSNHTVSREHARIRAEKADWYLEDLSSLNFTKLQGKVIPPFQPQPLRDGDSVSFGAVEMIIRLLGATDLPPAFSPS